MAPLGLESAALAIKRCDGLHELALVAGRSVPASGPFDARTPWPEGLAPRDSSLLVLPLVSRAGCGGFLVLGGCARGGRLYRSLADALAEKVAALAAR